MNRKWNSFSFLFSIPFQHSKYGHRVKHHRDSTKKLEDSKAQKTGHQNNHSSNWFGFVRAHTVIVSLQPLIYLIKSTLLPPFQTTNTPESIKTLIYISRTNKKWKEIIISTSIFSFGSCSPNWSSRIIYSAKRRWPKKKNSFLLFLTWLH